MQVVGSLSMWPCKKLWTCPGCLCPKAAAIGSSTPTILSAGEAVRKNGWVEGWMDEMTIKMNKNDLINTCWSEINNLCTLK